MIHSHLGQEKRAASNKPARGSGPDSLRVRFRGIAVMYMSGYSRQSAVDSQFEEGAAVLEKPFASDLLLHRVQRVLDEE